MSKRGEAEPGSWRSAARPLIAAIIARVGRADPAALRKALHDAYPFGERAMLPYKVWCDEVKRQRDGDLRPDQRNPQQGTLV